MKEEWPYLHSGVCANKVHLFALHMHGVNMISQKPM